MSLNKILKNLFFSSILFVGLLILSKSALCQEITAINFNGEPIGKVIPDGKVVSFENKLIGNVTADSLIINSKGELIGGVVPQGVAIGIDAQFLGKVSSDGSVRSSSGQLVGKALPNGLVVDEYFDIKGQVLFPGLVYNDEGKVAGRVTGDGYYTSLVGQQLGIVTPDGYAYRKVGTDYLLDGRLISSKMVVSIAGNFIGSIVPGGQVTDFNSKSIGRVKANGFVYDDNNNVIGRAVSSGYAFDDNGYYLGFVSYNGEVINANKVVGKMRADGRIVNINGKLYGHNTDYFGMLALIKKNNIDCYNKKVLILGTGGTSKTAYAVLKDLGAKIILKASINKCKPVILEPIELVEITVPSEYLGDVMGDVSARRGNVDGMEQRGNAQVIRAFIPLAEMFGYATDLRSFTQGRGNYSMVFDHYEPVPKNISEEIIKKNGEL